MFEQTTRVAAQLIYCSPTKVLHRAVVELDKQKNIIRLFNLEDNQVESAHTLFFDGIITGEIRSIKQHKTPEEIKGLASDYQYFDISDDTSGFGITVSNKPLMLDFGTNFPEEINRRLPCLIPVLGEFSILEIIAACVYYPALVLGESAMLSPASPAQLLLWEGVDLVNKKVTEHTRIRSIHSSGLTLRKQ